MLLWHRWHWRRNEAGLEAVLVLLRILKSCLLWLQCRRKESVDACLLRELWLWSLRERRLEAGLLRLHLGKLLWLLLTELTVLHETGGLWYLLRHLLLMLHTSLHWKLLETIWGTIHELLIWEVLSINTEVLTRLHAVLKTCVLLSQAYLIETLPRWCNLTLEATRRRHASHLSLKWRNTESTLLSLRCRQRSVWWRRNGQSCLLGDELMWRWSLSSNVKLVSDLRCEAVIGRTALLLR